MDDLNPAHFTVLQPYFDSMRVKRGIRKKVLDDASRLFPRALVLFKDNGNICSTRHVTSVPSIHEIYPLHRLVKNFIRAAFNNNPWMQGGADPPFAKAGLDPRDRFAKPRCSGHSRDRWRHKATVGG